MDRLLVTTSAREQMVNITGPTQSLVTQRGWRDGILTLFCPHTSASILLCEGHDPNVGIDFLRSMTRLVPGEHLYRHEGNPDAHIKASLTGHSLQIFIENGQLQLGSWQGVFFCDFDGPRPREVWLKYKG
ncbi:MAG: secondary thiamine-phosphate synthase enzyme YjbQ [Desulfovibrionaceae bacterium]